MCYQLTSTSRVMPPQCASRRFLNVFTVLLLTTSQGRGFQVGAMLIGKKWGANDVLKRLTMNFFPLFRVLSLKSQSKRSIELTQLNLFRYLNTSLSCPLGLIRTRLVSSKSLSRCQQQWFWISGIIFAAFLCALSIVSMSLRKCGYQNWTAYSRWGRTRDLQSGDEVSAVRGREKLWFLELFINTFKASDVRTSAGSLLLTLILLKFIDIFTF